VTLTSTTTPVFVGQSITFTATVGPTSLDPSSSMARPRLALLRPCRARRHTQPPTRRRWLRDRTASRRPIFRAATPNSPGAARQLKWRWCNILRR
jgi:hypothetical protein